MIVHPYRPELNGQDLSEHSDRAGKRMFVEFARLVKADGAGYAEYLWQWKDDERRVVPKLSYVKGFEPWGWIIGTGIYLEDVRAQVSDITRRVIQVAITFSVLIAGLLVYMTKQSLGLERQRGAARPPCASPRRSTGRSLKARPRASCFSSRDVSSTPTARCSRCCTTRRRTWPGWSGGSCSTRFRHFSSGRRRRTPGSGCRPSGRTAPASTCWWARPPSRSGTDRACSCPSRT